MLLLPFLVFRGFAQDKAAALLSVSHYDKEIKQNNSKLSKIQTELEQGREKLKVLQKQEGTFLGQLEQVEKNIAKSHSYISLLAVRIDTVEVIILSLQDSLKSAGRKYEARQTIMRKRLRQAYMQGTNYPILMLFGANSPLDAINRVQYIEKLNQYDRTLADQIMRSRREIEQKKMVQQQEREHLTMLREAKESEQKQLVSEERRRREMLKEVQSKKKSYKTMVAELEASQRELAAMIKLLESRRVKARKTTTLKQGTLTFDKRKGSLPWPVVGPVVTIFGKVVHPVYKTVIMSNGIDIDAKKGEPVHVVMAGTVIHTGSMRGLGKMVIVDHTGGFITIYAHLEQIAVTIDEAVESQMVLGSVGETGSIGGAKLHFEIRKSADALDPVEWLEKR